MAKVRRLPVRTPESVPFEQEFLFLSRERNHVREGVFEVAGISGKRLNHIREEYAKKAGSTASRAISAGHRFRHFCATHLRDYDWELPDIRECLGQTSIRPVEVNARCSTRRQRDKFARLRKSDGLAGV
jgi:integrase